MFRATINFLCIAMLAAGSFAPALAENGNSLADSIVRCTSIYARQEHDHRISLHQEKLGAEDVVHVYLTLTDAPLPYIFSLGWFSIIGNDKSPACVDEFEQQLPMPDEKPLHLSKDKGDWQAIRGFDLASAGEFKSALGNFKSAAEQSAESARMHNNLGACLAVLGQIDKAEEELNLSIKLNPSYYAALSNRAWLSLSKNKPAQALEDANRAMQDPDLKAARFAAVRAQLNLKQIDGAGKLAEDTYKRWPSDRSSLICSAEALLASGDVKEARNRYQKALSASPGDAPLLLKLAEIAETLGDLDEALKRARQASAAEPDSADAHLALGRYLEMNRENRAAQIQFERALELNPPEQTRLAVYGPMLRVLITLNRLKEADKFSKKWLSDNQDNADCHYNRAWIAAQLQGDKHLEEAVNEYKQALALDARLVQTHYNLALLFVKLNKSNEAVKELKAFINQAPQDPDIANARKLLAQLGQ